NVSAMGNPGLDQHFSLPATHFVPVHFELLIRKELSSEAGLTSGQGVPPSRRHLLSVEPWASP
ncbi:MAG: hypothetical protein V3T77_06545, partial [Planctomycetota bacterium]